MKYLCRIMFIFLMFMVTVCANAFCGDISVAELKSIDTIAAIQNHNCDALTAKNNETIAQCIQRNDSILINNKKSDDSNNGNLNNLLLGNTNQFNELLAYIYNQSFLHNKSKVHFSVILSEIQPNAP